MQGIKVVDGIAGRDLRVVDTRPTDDGVFVVVDLHLCVKVARVVVAVLVLVKVERACSGGTVGRRR